MNYYIISIIIFLFSTLSLVSNEIKGREFVATFLPNYHNNWYDPEDRFQLGDSVYLFIYAEKAANITIEYSNQLGQDFTENYFIQDNSIFTFKKPAYYYALIGYNESGETSNRNNSERITDLSFRITSDEPILVYGHSQAVTTSESFNVLPLETLGNEYIVAAYNSSRYYSEFDFPTGSTPSQFAIVATEDDTEVYFKPSAATRFNRLNEQNIKLKKNEVYLVQANISQTEQYGDLTGTYIKSNKPIAVFGGQQRSAVPYDISGQSPSRDYLVEQIPTLESWSLEAYVVPFPQPSIIQTTTSDVFRVIAGFDNTDIFVDDVFYGSINRGKYLEIPLDKAYKIQASAPILVVSYKRTSQTISNSSTLGDPLMQINPSVDQYGNNYKFISIQAYEYKEATKTYSRVYNEHFITLIIPTKSMNNIILDGVNLNTNNFQKIDGTDFYYGYRQVGEGIHTISSPHDFGLFVAGYGYANSYGYFSGIITKRDDFEPPTFQSNLDCFKVIGKIEDKKIASAKDDATKTNNLKIDIEAFSPYVQELNFSAELINYKFDGKSRIVAIDSIGQQNYLDIVIPGFTVGLTSAVNIDQIEPTITYDTLQLFENKCYNFTLRNYGEFDQTITKANFKSVNHFTTDLPDTFILKASEEKQFSICLISDSNNIFIDTLFIESNCAKQDLIVLDLLSKKDDNLPILTSKKDPCNEQISIIITDSTKIDRGIKEVVIEQNDNLEVIETFRNKSIINISAIVLDPYQDSYLSIKAIDSAGLSINFKDTIPGFTVQISGIDSSINKLNFGNKKIGIEHCETISLTNYGNFDFTFSDVKLSHNIYFSLPLNQLPFTIKPNETKELTLCFKGYIASTESIYDTLHLVYNCLEQVVSLESIPDSLIIDNNSRCDVNLIFSSGEIDNQNTVGKIYPNPVVDKIQFILTNSTSSKINGKIYNLKGELISDYIDEFYPKGIFEITVDTDNFENGIYINTVKINDELFNEIFIISK